MNMKSPTSVTTFSAGEIEVDKRSKQLLMVLGDLVPALMRHVLCDWGYISKSQRRANMLALKKGGPLRSVFYSSNGVKFSIVTATNRSVTRIKAL
jgi:hypothetical protein